jgi:beta-lactamase class A
MISDSDNTAVQTLFRIGGARPGMEASFRRWQVSGIRVDRYEGQCGLASHGVLNPPPIGKWTPGISKQLITEVPLKRQYSGMQRFLADPRDTSTPQATVELLARIFHGELLSSRSFGVLVQAMEATTTGERRLRGLLPPSTVVAHKTGTTDTIMGLNGATNDVGVIMLPHMTGQLAIAVYIKGSTRDENTRDSIIAQIASAAYDHWTRS